MYVAPMNSAGDIRRHRKIYLIIIITIFVFVQHQNTSQ